MVAGSAAGGTILAKSKLLLCLYTVFFGNVIAAPAFFTNQPDRHTHVFFLCHKSVIVSGLPRLRKPGEGKLAGDEIIMLYGKYS